MPAHILSDEEVARRGEDLYLRRIRAAVDPACDGQFIAIDVETGDYEVAPEDIAAIQRAKARRPDAQLYILRIGRATAYKIGSRFRAVAE